MGECRSTNRCQENRKIVATSQVITSFYSHYASSEDDYAKFSAVHIMVHSPKKDRLAPRALQKHLTISPIPLLSVAGPKRIGLKSYFPLSALLVKSSLITSSDASTHFRPA